MFTSDIDRNNNIKHIRNSLIGYVLISLFLIAFYKIYISFSYGQDSYYMRYMFLVSLIGGLIEVTILLVCHKNNYRPRSSFNMWNSGLALIVSGCLIEGIVSISGRYTDAEEAYFMAGVAFLILALVVAIIRLMSAVRINKLTLKLSAKT